MCSVQCEAPAANGAAAARHRERREMREQMDRNRSGHATLGQSDGQTRVRGPDRNGRSPYHAAVEGQTDRQTESEGSQVR